MCGAFATSPPSGSKRAQEKSSRSLTLVDTAVLFSISPISAAIPEKRLVKSSRTTASGAVGAERAGWAGFGRLGIQRSSSRNRIRRSATSRGEL